MTYSLIARRQSAGLSGTIHLPNQERWVAFELMGWDIFVRALDGVYVQDRIDVSPARISLVLGSPTNLHFLRSIAMAFDGGATTASIAQLFRILYAAIGPAAFNLVEGPFNYLEFTRNALFAANDTLGMQPLNIVHGRTVWVCSELKHVGQIEHGVFRFLPAHQVLASDIRPDHYLPIDNASRFKPGTYTTLYTDGFGELSLDTSAYHIPRLAEAQKLPPMVVRQRIAELLASTVRSSIDTAGRIFVPLSGGLDSSMVTSLATRSRADIETFALGTGRSNEFPFARIVSDHLKTRHKELDYSSSEIIAGLNQAIYHNEIFDGLSAEIQSTLMCFYRSVGVKDARVITGYGADLLFGGVLSRNDAMDDVNARLWAQIYRTRWTGEFSPFGAAAYGLDVQHPFWRPSLIGFAASLAPQLKLSGRDVKIALRECAEACELLPPSIVWRKKIGIHEGSSVNAIFADHIGTSAKDYTAKTAYSYTQYVSFISGQAMPQD